jgi:hypothetical protein
MEGQRLQENPIHRNTPTGDCRLCLGCIAAPIRHGMVRVGCPVNVDALGERVHVPNHFGSRQEILSPFVRHFRFCGRPVVVFTADLDGTSRSAFNEPLDSHNRDAKMLIMRKSHPFDEPSPSFARRHPENTDVVGVQQNHGACSANAA